MFRQFGADTLHCGHQTPKLVSPSPQPHVISAASMPARAAMPPALGWPGGRHANRRVQVLLEADEQLPDRRRSAQMLLRVLQPVVFQLQQALELLRVQLAHAGFDVLPQHKGKERLLLLIVALQDALLMHLHPLGARHRREGECDVGEDVKDVALAGSHFHNRRVASRHARPWPRGNQPIRLQQAFAFDLDFTARLHDESIAHPLGKRCRDVDRAGLAV